MITKNIVITSIVGTALLAPLLLVNAASAAVRCETQYGGAQVCIKTGALQVNKQVKHVTGKGGPVSTGVGQGGEHEWKDFLGMQAGVRFRPGDEVTFRIQVKNVGDAKFDKVTVTDTLPAFLELASGNTTTEITNLGPGQTQDVFVVGRVIGADRLAKAIDCAVNVAEARGRDVSGQDANDKDSVEVCFEKAVGQPAGLPKAGFESGILAFFLSIFATGSGIYLLRLNAASMRG